MSALEFASPYKDFLAQFPILMRHELLGGGIACHPGWKLLLEGCFERMESNLTQGMAQGFERSTHPDFTAGISPEDLAIPQMAVRAVDRARKGWMQDLERGDWVRVPFLVQVKEKMGGLRIYGDGLHSTPALVTEIQKAEKKAAHTCEVCGSHGTMLSIRGYWTVRCLAHSKKA